MLTLELLLYFYRCRHVSKYTCIELTPKYLFFLTSYLETGLNSIQSADWINLLLAQQTRQDDLYEHFILYSTVSLALQGIELLTSKLITLNPKKSDFIVHLMATHTSLFIHCS